MSLFTPTYTVHDGAGNEKFVVEVPTSSSTSGQHQFDLKYLSTFHFLTKMAEIFCGVKVNAKAAGNIFLRSLDTLEILENG